MKKKYILRMPQVKLKLIAFFQYRKEKKTIDLFTTDHDDLLSERFHNPVQHVTLKSPPLRICASAFAYYNDIDMVAR